MRPLITIAFVLMSLLGFAVTACEQVSSNDYYENEKHGGYPGPGVRTPGRDY